MLGSHGGGANGADLAERRVVESRGLGFTRIEVAQGRRDARRSFVVEKLTVEKRVEKRAREAHRSWAAWRGAERRGGARRGAGSGEGAWSAGEGA